MKTKTGFSISELLGVIAIVVILAAILFPVFAKAIEGEKAKQAQCISNLKKLGSALKQYAQDNDGKLPPLRNTVTQTLWGKLVCPYLPGSNGSSVFGYNFMRCPSIPSTYSATYGINYPYVMAYDNWLGGAILNKIPSNVYIAADYAGNYSFDSAILNPGSPNWIFNTDSDADGIKDSNHAMLSTYGRYNGFNPVHNKGGNFLFGDGHVKWVTLLGFIGNKDGIWGSIVASDYR